MKLRLPAALALALPWALGACSQYASVAEKAPSFQPARATAGALIGIQRGIAEALELRSENPQTAIGELLSAARDAAEQLAAAPDDTAARDTYNFAISRVFGVIKDAGLDPWSQPLAVPSPRGNIILTHRPDPRPQWNPALYDFTPADRIELSGKYIKDRTVRPGIGAALVATGHDQNELAGKDFTTSRIYYGVTAVVRFEGERAIVSFEDPLATENVRFAGRTRPLAADFTTPLAVMLANTKAKRIEFMRLLRPAEYAETARIARLQPYDPNKTVVLVIHGLMDSEATWIPMINTLRGDPEVRKNFQFWFFSYPSGYPYPHSAAILRRELDAVEKRFPLKKKMVVVGHSMGGCISRLLITDSGNDLWMKIFEKQPGEVTLSPESRKFFTDALVFRHRREVGRVVFIAAPLKGSELASNWIGRLGTRLVKSPTSFLKAGSEALQSISFKEDELRLKEIPDSVDTLAPNNRFVRAINAIPITPGIPYHSIMGDRGKGNTPDSSDGVVPYWSSHMEGSVSEKIVPSGHSAHQNPEAIAEVRRILLLHASGR